MLRRFLHDLIYFHLCNSYHLLVQKEIVVYDCGHGIKCPDVDADRSYAGSMEKTFSTKYLQVQEKK